MTAPSKPCFWKAVVLNGPCPPEYSGKPQLGVLGLCIRWWFNLPPPPRCALSPGTGQVPRADRERGQWTDTSSSASLTSSICCCLNLIREGNCPPWAIRTSMTTGKGELLWGGGRRETKMWEWILNADTQTEEFAFFIVPNICMSKQKWTYPICWKKSSRSPPWKGPGSRFLKKIDGLFFLSFPQNKQAIS